MFKKFISLLTLICFINSYCMQEVLATPPRPENASDEARVRHRVLPNKNGEFVINEDTINYKEIFDIDLIHEDVVVGSLINYLGHVSLSSQGGHNFYMDNLPKLYSLFIKIGGSIRIENEVHCKDHLNLDTLGSATFMKGFNVESEAGSAVFKASHLELAGKSFAKATKFSNLPEFVLQKKSSFLTDLLVSDGKMKLLKILGELQSKMTQLEIAEVACDGSLDFGQGVMNAETITNKGKLKAAIIAPKKSWNNWTSGEVTATECLHANVAEYRDDGITSVYGLATINAERGRISKKMLARNARISFKSTLSMPKDSTLIIQDHLMLHSGENLELYGDVISRNFDKEWPTLELTPTLREKLRNLNKIGWLLTAAKDITKKGNVKASSADIVYSAGGNYYGVQGVTRAGFFKNNITIMADGAKLADEMKSYNNLTLGLRKTAELMGSRHVDEFFLFDVGSLKQSEGDQLQAKAIVGKTESASLAGTVEYKEALKLDVAKDYTSTSSFHLKTDKAAPAALKAETTRLGGSYQEAALQVDAETVIRDKSYCGKLTGAHTKANTILSETGSHHEVAGTNMEDAKKSIAVDKGAVVKADVNIFKAGSWIFNAGSIESAQQYLADTAIHLNMFGGRINSGHNMIFADVMNVNCSGTASQLMMNHTGGYLSRVINAVSPELLNLNCFKPSDKDSHLLSHLSSIAGNSTEINTALNINALGIVRGTESLKVNALVNANAGLYLSRNATVNTIWDAPCLGVTAFDPGGLLDPSALLGTTSTSSFLNPALTMLAGATTGGAAFCIKSAQLAWNLSGLVKTSFQIWTQDNKGDEHNYWRLSRLVKRTGEYAGLGVQAYQNYNEFTDLRDNYNKTFYPQPPNDSQNNKKDSEQTSENKEPKTFVEKLAEQATLDNLQNIGMNFIPGTMSTNSIFGCGNGVNIMPHIIKRSFYLNDNSRNLAIDRMVKAGTGKDNSSTLAKTNNVSSHGDLEFGATVIASVNKVHTGGDLVLKKGMDVSAETNHFKSDKKLTAEEGGRAVGKTNIIEAKNDILFEGGSTAEKTYIKSEKGRADVTDKAKLVAIGKTEQTEDDKQNAPNIVAQDVTGGQFKAQVSGDAKVYVESEGHNDFAPNMDGISAHIKAKTCNFGGKNKLSQSENGLIIDAHVKFDSNTELSIGDKPIVISEAEIDAQIQLVKDSEQSQQQPQPEQTDSPDPQAKDSKEKKNHVSKKNRASKANNIAKQAILDNPNLLLRSKKGRKRSSKKETIHKPVETPAPQQQPETTESEALTPNESASEVPPETPKPPQKFSAIIRGSTFLDGHVAVTHGFCVIDLPAQEDSTQPRGLTLGSHLHLTGGGDLVGNTAGMIVKESGSHVAMKNVSLHGDEGVIIDGTSLAQENFVATSKKDVIEADNSNTKAGKVVIFHAEGKMIKKEGAKANAPEVIRHGEKGGECAGTVEAALFASFTAGEGEDTKVKIADGTIFKAPHQQIGSFAKPTPKEEETPNEDIAENAIEPKETETQPQEPVVQEQDGHKKKHRSQEPNPYSRAKTQPKDREKKPKRDMKESRKMKQEAPKPISDLPPISNAGEVEIGEGVQFIGKTLKLRGKGIGHLKALFTQSDYFEGVDITDYIYVHTDKDVTFNKSMTSASKGFELHTNQISVLENVILDAPEILRFHSTEKDLFLGYNSTLAANVFLEVMSDKDIVGDFEKKIIQHKDGSQTVEFKGVNLIGGSGLEYTYTDPETQIQTQRFLGLNVDAKGRVFATGMKLAGQGDIRIHGFEDVINKGASQLYVKEKKEESNVWRDKTKVYYDTEFFMPAVFTDGKLIVCSENGGLMWQAGFFSAKDGADLLFNDHVHFLPLKGKKGKTTERDTLVTFADSEDITIEGLAPSTVFVNQGDTKVRIWTSPYHDIIAPGFTYEGEKGTLDTRARWGYFSRPILKNYSTRSGASVSCDYSLMAHWKSLEALKSAKSLVHNLSQHNWGGSLSDMFMPSVTAGIDWTTMRSSWETLGAGSIKTKDWVMHFRKGLITDNAYGVDVTGTLFTNGLPYWYQGGANLRHSSVTDSFGIFASFNGSGPSVGLRYGHNETSGNNQQAGEFKIGKQEGDIGKVVQDAAHMDIKVLDGRIDEVVSYTRQNHSETSGYGGSVQWNLSGPPSASGHAYSNDSLNTTHQSGISVKHVTENASIGEAYLEGAKINGIKPEHQTTKSLPHDYSKGRAIGVGVSPNGLQNVMVGYSKNGNEIQLSLNVSAISDKGKEEADPWRQIGMVTVNGFQLPIITSINPTFFKEFGNDLSQLGHQVVDTATQLIKPRLANPREQGRFEEATYQRFQDDRESTTFLDDDIPFMNEIAKPIVPQDDSEEMLPVQDPSSSQQVESKVSDNDIWDEVDPIYPTYKEDKRMQEDIMEGIGNGITTMAENINKNSVDSPIITTDPIYPTYEEDKAMQEYFGELWEQGGENYKKNSQGVPESTTDYDSPAFEEMRDFWHAKQPYLKETYENYMNNIGPLQELADYDTGFVNSLKNGNSSFVKGFRYAIYLVGNNGEEATEVMKTGNDAQNFAKEFPRTHGDIVWLVGKEFGKMWFDAFLKENKYTLPTFTPSPGKFMNTDPK